MNSIQGVGKSTPCSTFILCNGKFSLKNSIIGVAIWYHVRQRLVLIFKLLLLKHIVINYLQIYIYYTLEDFSKETIGHLESSMPTLNY